MALNKKNRLNKKKDFETVFKKGQAVKGSFLFAKFIKNSLGLPRLAFVVSSRVSKKAVVRNRIRRLLSEDSRQSLGKLGSVDIIVMANKNITDAPREDVRNDLLDVFKRIK